MKSKGMCFAKCNIMKHFLICTTLLCSLFASCQTDDDNADDTSNGKKNISKRDYSITRANSYSDLFLDSMDLEKYITKNTIADSVARRMRSFYNTRNYQYAWFFSKGITEQALGFWNLYDYYINYEMDSIPKHEKSFHNKMDDLVALENLKISEKNENFRQTELQLTERLIHYSLRTFLVNKQVKRKELERFVPFKKENAMQLADSLINKKHKDDKYFEDINEAYGKLKNELVRYYSIAKNGGWKPVNFSGKTLKKGNTHPVVKGIKKRLRITGEYTAKDSSDIYTDSLAVAVATYQQRFGFTPNGEVTAALIKEMNVPAEKRVKQILINLGRMRWMPSRPEGEMIMVNIPEFKMHVTENKQKVFDMNVVVGKEGHNTVMFTGDLNQIVFSPYWNVPPSIVKNEILPAMQKDPDYLFKNNMEQVGMEGDLPKIRQRPGPDNALGKVKFLFPNKFNIYFHDTNAKSLFSRDKRAFSHGCIRIAEPEKMANYLLRNQSEWTPSRVYEAMNSGTEKYVKLKKKIPVFITYYTVWVDDNGLLNFRDDIYKHDAVIAKEMFTTAY